MCHIVAVQLKVVTTVLRRTCSYYVFIYNVELLGTFI